MLIRTAEGAKLDKHVHPHLFRHSRASFYANKLTEQQLKAYFGWTSDSKMASVYVHLSGRDIDNGILLANGLKPQEGSIEPKLKVALCPKCRHTNGVDSAYCSNCGSAMNISTAMQQQSDKQNLQKLFAEWMEEKERVQNQLGIIREANTKERQETENIEDELRKSPKNAELVRMNALF